MGRAARRLGRCRATLALGLCTTILGTVAPSAAQTDDETRTRLREEQLAHLETWVAGYEATPDRMGIDPSVDLPTFVLLTWAIELGLGVSLGQKRFAHGSFTPGLSPKSAASCEHASHIGSVSPRSSASLASRPHTEHHRSPESSPTRSPSSSAVSPSRASESRVSMSRTHRDECPSRAHTPRPRPPQRMQTANHDRVTRA